MPLFGRRSRSVSVSRPTTPANNSPALLAASQAFTGSHGPQGPQTKLATGAAAAALRSKSPASTPVSHVQTKRMMERQGSVGSAQNAPRGRSRGNNMVRRNSSSSMTERTFRAESPARPATSNGMPQSRPAEPPVPPVPQGYSDVPPIPKKSHRRSASIDEIQVRKNAGRQPMDRNSVAGAPVSSPVANPASLAARRVTSGQMPPQLDRADSQNSVNFSYPGRARPTSPPPQKQKFDSPVSQATRPEPPAAASKAISDTETRNIQHGLAQTAQQPVKKKKKREGPLTEGSRLQTGTMGHKPVVTPLAPGPLQPKLESSEEADRGQNNAKITGQASHFPPSPVSPTDSRGSDSEGEQRTRTRRTQRASGALTKQPSVVREDWEGEQEDPPSSPLGASPIPARLAPSKRQTAEANVSRKIEGNGTTNRPDQEPAETAQPLQNLAVATETRKPSLSPSRSTRFSNRLSSDMTEGQKHEPPPRSVSPRKPALKHSNSPHILPIDTQRARDPSLTPSDTTDLSADGAPRRKKTAHVKFDNQPAVVGIAAEADSPSTPQVTSPQYKEKEKKWFGKKPNRVVLSEDSDDEDAMKPRPQLPTFGSVRNGRRNEAEPSSSQRLASSPSSSSSSSISSDTRPTTIDTSISSDHALGGILARDSEQKKAAGQSPLPPEVTSVEGTGMHSDTESTHSQDNDTIVEPPVQRFSAYQQATSHPLKTVENVADVPTIALQPATPGTEEEPKHQDQWLVEVPGGFPTSSGEAPVAAPAKEAAAPQPVQPELTSSVSGNQPWQDDSQIHQTMPSIQEEDSDRDSIYSDAEEEISDTEGDGFGSINAIVHSPTIASPDARSTPPQSPTITATQHQVGRESEQGTSDWNDVGARWKDHRNNIQRASLQPAATIVEETAQQPTRKVAEKSSTAPTQKSAPSPASTTGSTFTPTQSPSPTGAARAARASAQPGIRKSMRSEPESAPAPTFRAQAGSNDDRHRTIRSSMRNSAGPAQSTEGLKTMKSSMRQAAAPVVPATAASPQPQMHGTLQKKNLRTSAPPPARTALPPVNDDSDSDSSFRKRRRAKANDGGKYSMRRSMRAGSESAPVSSAQARNAVRSLSPVERRPFSPVGGQASMRTTMRGSTDHTPTLRGDQNSGKRSSSLFGRKRDAKSPTRPMSVVGFSKSRIAESDDEGNARPKRTFKSRFGDSSDDEDDLPPVRGIPRKAKDDDSTDLEDSSDEERKKVRKTAQGQSLSIAVPPSPQFPERPTSPVSPGEKKKRGFFGRLRKGKDEPASPTSKEPQPAVNGTTEPATAVPQNTASGVGSEAQKEALIEHARKKLEASGEISKTIQPTSPTPGKLQRRVTPSRVMSDSWPLPPKIPDDNEAVDRPYTSDGSNPRPPIGERQISSGATATSPVGSEEAAGKGAKKKRFPMLRKAFGLKD